MTDERWAEVDAFLTDRFAPADAALNTALAASDAAGLPAIQVSAPQGKLLELLARAQGAKRILEIGTLGGYSTIWLARALPADGRLVTLELDPHHAEVARANLAGAGVADRVEVRVGAALQALPQLVTEEPFDFVFIDADKANYPAYLRWSLQLTRVGGVIVADNVVRGGQIVGAASDDANVAGTREFLALLADEPRLAATVIQTVGNKGWDGFSYALKTR